MLVSMILAVALQSAAVLEGPALIVDGQSLDVGGHRVRLWGLDAPSRDQTCTRDGATYPCGQEAARHLEGLIAGRPVTCTPRGEQGAFGPIIAQCEVTADCEPQDDCQTFRRDIGAWMVGGGWAMDDPRASDSEHAEQQWDAEQARVGLWAGEFRQAEAAGEVPPTEACFARLADAEGEMELAQDPVWRQKARVELAQMRLETERWRSELAAGLAEHAARRAALQRERDSGALAEDDFTSARSELEAEARRLTEEQNTPQLPECGF